ncbi:hypothetical protein E2C01_052392 [Portunus trituberculatus]|uniref:Uncharacterized protein n=1 Tax=Portunus trituberculatus TaxID=210409 RepID=A0A5B7GMV5_PORTR|nr:hypothetical protein [Portunus trituberculatus]
MVRQNWHSLSPSLMTLFVPFNNPCLHILCAQRQGGRALGKKQGGKEGWRRKGDGNHVSSPFSRVPQGPILLSVS